MKTVIKFEMNGKKVKIEENAVFCKDLVLNQKIVNWLIHCRIETTSSHEALMMLFNQYLRFMPLQNLKMEKVKPQSYVVPEFIEKAIYADQYAA